jgi:deoxyribose-phosphate aldolase
LSPFETRLAEVKASVEAGAAEIDIVITRSHVLTGNWQALYDEVAAFREACGEAHMKSILATGELATLTNVARASMVAMMAGSDFIKTSTGKEGTNATLPVSLVMVRMIREYFAQTGYAVGYKPAGGIRSAKNSLEYLYLMKEELGDRWLRADLFRFGASGLLTDIERQLEHFATGRYSAAHRQPMV